MKSGWLYVIVCKAVNYKSVGKFFLWSLCPWVNVAWHSEKSHIKASPQPVFIKEEIQLAATSNSLPLAHILSCTVNAVYTHKSYKSPHTAQIILT